MQPAKFVYFFIVRLGYTAHLGKEPNFPAKKNHPAHHGAVFTHPCKLFPIFTNSVIFSVWKNFVSSCYFRS